MQRVFILFIICSITILLACIACSQQSTGIHGLYISKGPSLSDKISLMYLRGYRSFLYTAPNEDTLYINQDSTFIHINNYCKGSDKLYGKWKVGGGKLYLKYSGTSLYKNTSFTTFKDKVYRIDDAVLSGSDKKVKHLTLYKKQ